MEKGKKRIFKRYKPANVTSLDFIIRNTELQQSHLSFQMFQEQHAHWFLLILMKNYVIIYA